MQTAATEFRQLGQYFSSHKDRYAAAFLFGSVANGNARTDSDIDIAVIPTIPLTADSKMALISDLAQLAQRPVDIIDLSTANGPILKQALTTGVRLIDNDAAATAQVMGRMLAYETDMAPLVKAAEQRQIRVWISS